jgi:formylglycine-generating enzyme required for sulfatase activity
VLSFHANAWGLHDMHGNVFEWCADYWYDYEDVANDGRAWVGSEAEEIIDKYKINTNSKLLRGGSWSSNPRGCRSACRDYDHPGSRGNFIGFRVCCLPQD